MSDKHMNDKESALKIAVSSLEKSFGRGSIMYLGEKNMSINIPKISTGSLKLDLMLEGGFPRGRIIEIFGAESSGKTTIALRAIAAAQKIGQCVFVDAEHALDPSYAAKLGVNLEKLLISQPDNGEQALETVDVLVRSGAVVLVVVDSVAALVPKAEIEGDMGDVHMGLQARLMSQALRKLTANISKSNAIVIFINQTRMKIGVMFGNPETTTGGNALKFYSSMRIEVRKSSPIKDGEQIVGNQIKAKTVKNKVSPPFKAVDLEIIYGEGISRTGEVLDIAVANNMIEKSGAWFSYKNQKIGQGKENAKKYLVENENILIELENEIRNRFMKGGDLAHDVVIDGTHSSGEEDIGSDSDDS